MDDQTNRPPEDEDEDDLDLGLHDLDLGAYEAISPSPDFVDKVMRARGRAEASSRGEVTPPSDPRRWRPLLLAGMSAALGAVAATVIVLTLPGAPPADVSTVTFNLPAPEPARTVLPMGDYGVAIGDKGAALEWRGQNGDALEVEQTAGNVLYALSREVPVVVTTPSGDVHISGSLFRVDIPKGAEQQAQVTILEGRGVLDGDQGGVEVFACESGVLEPGEKPVVVDIEPKILDERGSDEVEDVVERKRNEVEASIELE